MGDGIARVDCVCMYRVAQTRVRRLVAYCGYFVLRCFIGWAADCGGGCDGKEVNLCGRQNITAMILHKDVTKHAVRSNWFAGAGKPILSVFVLKDTLQMTRIVNFGKLMVSA